AKHEALQDKKDEARKKNEVLVIKSVNAAIALGEATAKAVQRIPDAHCNGDMHAALDYAAKIKHEQKDFLTEQGVDALY
ncbi:MAG: serine/threonine protein kinase, partial [Prevotella sp.]